MNKGVLKNLALILLLGVAAFSMVRYVSELETRFRLQDSLAQAQREVVVLTKEKQNLLQELEKEKKLNQQLAAKNVNLKVHLKASKDKMARLLWDNSKPQNELEDLNAKFAILKAQNRWLMDNHKRSYIENEQFKSKATKPETLGLETKGNQGFLAKEGRPTLEKIKIEVIPAKTKEQ